MIKNGNTSFTIRLATGEDIGTLAQLIRRLAEYERLADQAENTEALLQKYGFGEHPYFHAIIAEIADDGEKHAVGFALYFFTFSTFVCRPTLYLEDLFVLPEFRGRGIGKALFMELVRIAGEKECGRMEWSVLDWNEPAINFYQSLGAKAMSDWTVFRLDEEGINKLR